MATSQGTTTQNTTDMLQQSSISRGISNAGSPIDNLTYNVLTVLQQKCEGLEAYQKYMNDAQSNQEIRQLFEQIHQSDTQQVQQLRDCLSRLLMSSKQGGQSQNESSSQNATKSPKH